MFLRAVVTCQESDRASEQKDQGVGDIILNFLFA